MPCYPRGMKIYTKFRSCDSQAENSESFKHNKVVFILVFLLAAGFFPYQESFLGKTVRFISAAYGAEFPRQLSSSAGSSQPTTSFSAGIKQNIMQNITQNVQQNIVQATSLMQQSRTINNSTCGRPWQIPLSEIHGRIRNVEYRVQPLTGQRGLHLDIETSEQTETVIHVYPERLTAKCPSVFYFHVGDSVTVTGSEFFTSKGGMQQNICAATITQEEKVLDVRDPITGDLERQLCCQEICEKNCVGLPFMCDRMCMGNCGNKRLKAVFQNLPYQHPSWDKDYATTTFEH
ncbi:hypothetical protein H206_01718 [Candidatus Electrothrix aarhusensis]|uniref:Uncharacterized protein n=1 Tax=Candidatus Electrothrix aarhusensis TaxID=1859131 RepID=A0A3S3QWT0_9BACT|nr:hypothetical protein H206_01718 [Candidatus Electrothrix aarhusensis]